RVVRHQLKGRDRELRDRITAPIDRVPIPPRDRCTEREQHEAAAEKQRPPEPDERDHALHAANLALATRARTRLTRTSLADLDAENAQLARFGGLLRLDARPQLDPDPRRRVERCLPQAAERSEQVHRIMLARAPWRADETAHELRARRSRHANRPVRAAEG